MAEAAKHTETTSINATEEVKSTNATVEQSALCQETMSVPVLEEMKFRCEWTLWEHYENEQGQTDYASGMCKACWFNDMVSFAVAWNTIPHRDLTNIFYNDQTKSVKFVDVKGQMMRISGLSLFQKNIQPEWEDEVNKHGGQFRIDFKSSIAFLQTIWEKLIFSVVTDQFSDAAMLSGIRLLDKSTTSRENMFRIEIWTKFDNSQSGMVNALKTHLETEYVQLMIDDPTTRPSNNKINENIASDWLSLFKNNQSESTSRGGGR